MTRPTALLLVAFLSCELAHADEQPLWRRQRCPAPAGVSAIALSGPTAWIGFGHELLAVDTSDPSALRVRVAAELECGAHDMVAAGDYLYVATARSGLQILRIGNSPAPEEVGYFATAGSVHDLAAAPPYVFLAAYEGLQVIDMSDPSAPNEVARFKTPPVCYGVALENNRAYLLAGWYPDVALIVVDVSTPWNPRRLGEWDLRQISAIADSPGPGRRPVVSDGFALVPDPNRGLLVFDVTEPSSPKLVSRHALRHSMGVAVASRYAFVTSPRSGLHVIDLSTPLEPREVGRLDMPESAIEIVIRGDLALVTNGLGGLRSVDVSDVTAPMELDAVAVTDQSHVGRLPARPEPSNQRSPGASHSDGGSGS